MFDFVLGFMTAIFLLIILRAFTLRKAVDKVSSKGIDNMINDLDGITTLLANMHVTESKDEIHKYVLDDVLMRMGKIQTFILKTPVFLSKKNTKKVDRLKAILGAILKECSNEYDKLKLRQ